MNTTPNTAPDADALQYEVLDHGWDGDSYFPGCGVYGTRFLHVVTGRGYSAREAFDDALDQMGADINAPQCDENRDDITRTHAETLADAPDGGKAGGKMDAGPCNPKKPCCDNIGADPDDTCQDNAEACECCCHNPEWAYRVSIRWGTR